MRPIFIPEPQILSKIYYSKNFTLFSKIVKLSSKFQKFWYQIDEIVPIFAPILENSENITYVDTSFCTGLSHRYTGRRPILRPISAACLRIDLCTKNPPGPITMNTAYPKWHFIIMTTKHSQNVLINW